jgi:hypothetical protein
LLRYTNLIPADLTVYTPWKKGFQKGSLAVSIGETFLVPDRIFIGSGWNLFGFHVEPSVKRVLYGTQKVLTGIKRIVPGIERGSPMGCPMGTAD